MPALQKELIEDVKPAPESLSSSIDVLDDTPQATEVMTEMPLVEISPIVTSEEKTLEVVQTHPSETEDESEGQAEEAVDTENV